MKSVAETIKEELIKRCKNYEKKTNYNYWENHIKYLEYSREKIELVKKCVLNHRGSTKLNRELVEEQCVADVDVMAHFDCISDLFSLVYHDKNMNIKDGAEYVKKKLERDFEKLSPVSKEMLKDRYDTSMKILFV